MCLELHFFLNLTSRENRDIATVISLCLTNIAMYLSENVKLITKEWQFCTGPVKKRNNIYILHKEKRYSIHFVFLLFTAVIKMQWTMKVCPDRG